jgi:hypothetical protein
LPRPVEATGFFVFSISLHCVVSIAKHFGRLLIAIVLHGYRLRIIKGGKNLGLRYAKDTFHALHKTSLYGFTLKDV